MNLAHLTIAGSQIELWLVLVERMCVHQDRCVVSFN
jgi:hypothetical protein